MLTRLTVTIISQYIQISSYVTPGTNIVLKISYTSIKKEGNWFKGVPSIFWILNLYRSCVINVFSRFALYQFTFPVVSFFFFFKYSDFISIILQYPVLYISYKTLHLYNTNIFKESMLQDSIYISNSLAEFYQF